MLHFHKAELVDAQDITALINSAYRGESSRAGWTTEADILDGLRTTTQEVASIIKRDPFVAKQAHCIRLNNPTSQVTEQW